MLSGVLLTQLHTQTKGAPSRHGMTRPPERTGGPRETKPWDPPQRPDTDRGRTDAGRGEGRVQKPTHCPTHQGAPTRWRRRRGATRRDRATRRKDGDGGESRQHRAPESTPHRRGCGRGGERPSHRGARADRGGERRWSRTPDSINHQHSSGCADGWHSQGGAVAGQRKHTEGGGGGLTPQESAQGYGPSRRGDGREGPPRTVSRA